MVCSTLIAVTLLFLHASPEPHCLSFTTLEKGRKLCLKVYLVFDLVDLKLQISVQKSNSFKGVKNENFRSAFCGLS